MHSPNYLGPILAGERGFLTLKNLTKSSFVFTSGSAPLSGQDYWYSWEALLFQFCGGFCCCFRKICDNEKVLLPQILTLVSALQQQRWLQQTVCSTSYCESMKGYATSNRQNRPTKSLSISSEDSSPLSGQGHWYSWEAVHPSKSC